MKIFMTRANSNFSPFEKFRTQSETKLLLTSHMYCSQSAKIEISANKTNKAAYINMMYNNTNNIMYTIGEHE